MALNQNFSDFFAPPPAPAPKRQPAAPAPAPAPAPVPQDTFAGVPAWTDIQAKPEFKALPPAKQAEAKQAYFDYWIAPRVGQDADAIRQQFIGAAPEAPAVDEQAGQAAFGIYPSAGRRTQQPVQAAPVAPTPTPSASQTIEAGTDVGPEFGGPQVVTAEGDGPIGTVRNVAAGVLKIGPTAVKGVADITRMATGDRFGRDTSEAMERGMRSINEVVATARFNEQQRGFESVMKDDTKGVGDMFSYLLDNPSVLVDNTITTIGSMFLPAGAAKAAAVGAKALGAAQPTVTKAAMAATYGTVAAQNAADTFAELKDQPLDRRYQGAAVSAAVSLLAGVAARGGAEGEIARRLAGDLQTGRGSLQAVKQFLGAVFREAGQEAGEETGNIAGEAVGRRELPSFQSAAKRATFAGTLGGIMGGGVNLLGQASQVGQPAAPTAPTSADITVDGRIEPSADTAPPTDPTNPLVQTADEIVRGLATDAGIPEATVLPGATAPAAAITQGDQDILDFAGARFQQLRQKRDGTDEEPGPGLSPSEEQELQALVQARGNPVALRAFYGIPDQGAEDVRQTQEPLDGPASGAAPGQGAQGQAAPGAVPEQPGQQPNEDGQAQGLDQAIDGLGALFGETEAQREARLEREAIQGESDFQAQAPTNDDDIPLDLGPPRTEKEARQRKEQQANEQAGQAQQAETPREETLRAPAAPQGATAPGVGPKTEREAKQQRQEAAPPVQQPAPPGATPEEGAGSTQPTQVAPKTEKETALLKQYENSVLQWNQLSAQYKTANEDERAELRPMMDALNFEQARIKSELQKIVMQRGAEARRKEAGEKYGAMPVGTRIGMVGYEGGDDSYWEKVDDDRWQRTMGGKTDEVFKTSAEMEGNRVVRTPEAPIQPAPTAAPKTGAELLNERIKSDVAKKQQAKAPPPPPPPQAPSLEGVKVKFDVMVEDTGQTASMTVDAATQMKEYDERESVLRELIACLQK
jgi:hypothetical protein